MRITFHGAAQTVTGSQYLLEVNDRKILLDCGLYQGGGAESRKRNTCFAFNPLELDAVILSHAHIDHSGNLPNLVKQGYAGPIYGTEATKQLTDVMLRDSAKIQESDAEYYNRRHRDRGDAPVEPLYTLEDAQTVSRHFRPVRYDTPFEPVPGVTVKLVEAGHILGSAAVCLDIKEPGREPYRFWFSGDIGRRNMALLRDPVLPQNADYLLMESTYGDKSHDNPEEAYEEFVQVVRRTVDRGGKVIVPAFAVGRTQELVFLLNKAIQEDRLPDIPVFVDSPLAVEASEVFQRFTRLMDNEVREFIREENTPPLDFHSLTYVDDVAQSKALNTMHEPMVIISASGMAETGRILHHLRNNVENPCNTVLIVSYQAPDTLGRRMQEGQETVRIFGDEYQMRAEVATISGLSAHAGQNLLREYALAVKDTVKRVMLVHGEERPATLLQDRLLDAGIPEVDYPAMHESMDI